jgi:hypothetical protein
MTWARSDEPQHQAETIRGWLAAATPERLTRESAGWSAARWRAAARAAESLGVAPLLHRVLAARRTPLDCELPALGLPRACLRHLGRLAIRGARMLRAAARGVLPRLPSPPSAARVSPTRRAPDLVAARTTACSASPWPPRAGGSA